MSYCDYLFLLPPTQQMKLKIAAYKNMAGTLVGNYNGLHSTAHISVHHQRRSKPYLIRPLIERLKPKINHMPATVLNIDGFRYFNHQQESMTIYAAIKPSYKTDNWFAQLRQILNVQQTFVPHITIAKTIDIDNFMALWPSFKNQPFQESFIADRMMILERETFAPNSKWKIHEELLFNNGIRIQALK